MNEYMKLAKEQANKGMRNLEGGPFGAEIGRASCRERV